MSETLREDGCLPLNAYCGLGDGRSVALAGADGSIDWWCAPSMGCPPLFDRLLDPEEGGRFSITPSEPFTVERRYRDGSNVHETTFTTPSGTARLTESLNSGSAGRLPWCELARRLEGVTGTVEFRVEIRFGTRAGTCNPYLTPNPNGLLFHVGPVLGLIRFSEGVVAVEADDTLITARVAVSTGDREVLALVAGEDEPLIAPTIGEIDLRLDASDDEWKTWSDRIGYRGPHRDAVIRSSLALKLLLYSPTGAIVAAPTTSLPERIGGDRNYDYRFAWVRDAGYTITAFLAIGALAEAQAGFAWLIGRLEAHGPRVMYTLDGAVAPDVTEIEVPGYRRSNPVRIGNLATSQHQHGVYGDIFVVAWRFVESGAVLDDRTAEILSGLADRCADGWRQKDSGIWELSEQRHYTLSKISCWQALDRAVALADGGHLPTTCRDRWARERDRIEAWVEENCWSQDRGAYVAWPGTTDLDASVALAVRFGFPNLERLEKTLDLVDQELGAAPFHYRYTGADRDEGAFLACSFWMAQAKALLGRTGEAKAGFDALLDALDCEGVYPEMIDPKTGDWLGNMPQGLTHLSLIHAAMALAGEAARP